MDSQSLAELNKQLYFSIGSEDACARCKKLSKYSQDLVGLKIHCSLIDHYLQKYLTPDTSHIITSYIAEPGFICHFCKVYQDFTNQLRDKFVICTKYQKYNVGLPSDFENRCYIHDEKNNRYIRFGNGFRQIKCFTFLTKEDISFLLKSIHHIFNCGWDETYLPWDVFMDVTTRVRVPYKRDAEDKTVLAKIPKYTKQNGRWAKGNRKGGR